MPIPVQTGPFYEAQVILRPDINPLSNSWVNRFFFQDIAAVARSHDTVATSIKTILDSAYNVTHSPGTAPLASILGAQIDPGVTVYKVYRLQDTPPRIPVQKSASVWSVGTTGLPNEVALVMSYRTGPATTNGGSVDPRKRGRTYFGPLASITVSTSGQDDNYPTTALMNTLVGFGKYLLSSADMTTQELAWAQYSRVNNAFDDVDGGFVDQRWDTQRRRGSESLSRILFP